jgi:hypothetical protein
MAQHNSLKHNLGNPGGLPSKNVTPAENIPQTEDRWLTPDETADLLKVQKSTLGQWRCKKRGPVYVKRFGRVRYWQSDIAAFMMGDAENSQPSDKEAS